MASRTIVTCTDCNTALILPVDPEALAFAMTEFVDLHNSLQHFTFALGPPSEDLPEAASGG